MIEFICIQLLGLGLLFLVLYYFLGFMLLIQLDKIFLTKNSIGNRLRVVVGFIFYATIALSFMVLHSGYEETGSNIEEYILSFFIDANLYQSTSLVLFLVGSVITKFIAMNFVIKLHNKKSFKIQGMLSRILWIAMVLYAIAVTIVDFPTFIVMLFGGVLSIYIAVATSEDVE